jgi:hypothetical protein
MPDSIVMAHVLWPVQLCSSLPQIGGVSEAPAELVGRLPGGGFVPACACLALKAF